jgi:hypothetical protein
MIRLMKTYQKRFMDTDCSFDFKPYLDQLKGHLEDVTQGVPKIERVELYAILRSDYGLMLDLHFGAFEDHIEESAY